MKLRTVSENDISQISKLYFDTVRNINSRDYSTQQIKLWADDIKPDEFWSKRFENYDVNVVEQDGIILGFSEYQYPGHIDCFYVHHEYQRQGVGRMMIEQIETTAKKENSNRIFVDASLTARPFFAAMGFIEIKQQIRVLKETSFELFFMEKWL